MFHIFFFSPCRCKFTLKWIVWDQYNPKWSISLTKGWILYLSRQTELSCTCCFFCLQQFEIWSYFCFRCIAQTGVGIFFRCLFRQSQRLVCFGFCPSSRIFFSSISGKLNVDKNLRRCCRLRRSPSRSRCWCGWRLTKSGWIDVFVKSRSRSCSWWWLRRRHGRCC